MGLFSKVKKVAKKVSKKVSSATKSVASKVSSATKSVASKVSSATKSVASNVVSVGKELIQTNLEASLAGAQSLLSGGGLSGAIGAMAGTVVNKFTGASGEEFEYESPYGEDTSNVEQQAVNQTAKTATSASTGANVSGWKGRYNAFSYALKNGLQLKVSKK